MNFPVDSNALSGIPSISTIAGALFMVCIAAYFSLRFLYGRGALRRPGSSRKFIRILDRHPIAQNRALLVAEVAGKIYLLGSTDQSITCLGMIDPEAMPKDEVYESGNAPAPLAAYLSALSRRWKRNRKGPPDG